MIALIADNNVLASTVQFITILLIFLLVLAMTYITTRIAGVYKKQQMEGKNIKIRETIAISNSKYLQIIQVGERFFLIAVCKDSISYISELQSEDLNFVEGADSGESFMTILERFKKKECVSSDGMNGEDENSKTVDQES